ncbi:MAG TPA: thiamine pyrophosphate-dependent enzyme [Methanotrichaceae archaeon]|nr:thiamine pyrophosphate-dependent enzyme [Methanotrichaceae archaeon]
MQNLFTPGHRACAGCAMPTTIRLVLDAAGENTIVVSPTGCLEVTSTPYPESSWNVPWLHSLFENAAAVASGVEVTLRRQCKDTNVICIGGDGSTFDIGIGSISGMFDRGHNIKYICYDNEAYMNTGVQRSGSTPFCVHTTTTPSGKESMGNPRPKKNMPAIAVAHNVPYVATASVAYPVDLRKKIKRALEIPGPAYIQVNAPCITGWTFEAGSTIEIARLAVETGLWPLYEMVDGKLDGVKKIRALKPVEDYLKAQGRYKHLFKKSGGPDVLKAIQGIAQSNIEKYGLVD